MNIFLLRHGIAHVLGEDGSKTDAERTLTEDGRSKIRSVARALRTMNVKLDAVASSPLPRAAETAEIVAEALRIRHLLTLEGALSLGAAPEDYCRLLARRGREESILLVGHEPDLSRTVGFLLWGGSDGWRVAFKKGALCHIENDGNGWRGNGVLRSFLTPKQMKLM
jgi:phosphohistidine phosphatase